VEEEVKAKGRGVSEGSDDVVLIKEGKRKVGMAYISCWLAC